MVNTRETSWVAVKKVFRQHNSFVITLPVILIRAMEIRQGDYVEFEMQADCRLAKLRKVILRGENGREDS